MEKKFEKSWTVDDFEVLTPEGYVDIKTLHKTVPMTQYNIKTFSYTLSCADKHIVFDENNNEVFVEQLKVGDNIRTNNGIEEVLEITTSQDQVSMYDIQTNSFHQSYYTNGILSHNTATAALYLLWYAMFVPDSYILIAAHNGAGATEIMDRFRYAYEECPNHIRAGTTTYAAAKIVFDNKTTVVCSTTTANTGRGRSISLMYCLDANTKVTVKDKDTGEIKDITLEGLYTELNGDILVSMEKVPMYRMYLERPEHRFYIDVTETKTVLSNDEEVMVGDLMKGDTIDVGNYEYMVVDIVALPDSDEKEP